MEHDRCSVVRDALMKNFKNVLEANTTRTHIGDVDYCVAASALVKEGEMKKFETKIRNLKIKSPAISVKHAKVYFSKH